MSSGTRIEPRFEPREVLLANITFPNQEIKPRPILVISKFSSVSLIPSSTILVCLAITSNTDNDPYMIEIKNSDMEERSFPKQSKVVCNNIFTILKSDVTKRIGKVTPNFYNQITGLLRATVLEIDQINSTKPAT
jgi:mRNA-degrading endonuclease toxin of MazEF toxin-antitoxin module